MKKIVADQASDIDALKELTRGIRLTLSSAQQGRAHHTGGARRQFLFEPYLAPRKRAQIEGRCRSSFPSP